MLNLNQNRKQESTYNELLYYMCVLMQSKVVNSLQGLAFDDIQLEIKFTKIYKKMWVMERDKYLPPKFSRWFKQLASLFGVKLNKASHK